MPRRNYKILILGVVLVFAAVVGVVLYFVFSPSTTYSKAPISQKIKSAITHVKKESEPPAIEHVREPDSVKGIYMTGWVAGARNKTGEFYWRNDLVKLIDDTELNTIVVDIKDDTGRISFEIKTPEVQKFDTGTRRIPDLEAMIKEMHEKGIYVIGRVAVFQDPHLVALRPDLALHRLSDGGVWKDRKGLVWMDASSKEVWDYVVAIGKEAYNRGFDEIQFDYLRFPTDGNVHDIVFAHFDPNTQTKREVIKNFVHYAHEKFKEAGVPFSIDIFGQTTTAPDDMGIGQMFSDLIVEADTVSPMVYPSHFINNYGGFGDPNQHVYEVVKYSMGEAVARASAASTTSQKLRPWLQDFDYGGEYDAAKVRAQIQAVHDVGLDSWLLWDPSNKYTKEALLPE